MRYLSEGRQFLLWGLRRRLELIDGALLLARFVGDGGGDGRPKSGGGERDGLTLWWPYSWGGLLGGDAGVGVGGLR
jgi:hypothetical protein